MRAYDELLEAGNRAQLEKLHENSHKRGFDSIDLAYALSRIQEEVAELCAADTDQELRREAADIANFAHMIIYAIDRRTTNGQ